MASEIDAELARLRGKIAELRADNLQVRREKDLATHALTKARGKRDQWQRELAAERRLKETHARDAENARTERDSARALLQLVWQSDATMPVPPITRARIAKELGQ